MTGSAACRWTVMRCREPAFQDFLGVDGEEAAAREVKRRLAIKSRTEVDRDPAAAARWNDLRRAFLQYQTTHHNQDQEM